MWMGGDEMGCLNRSLFDAEDNLRCLDDGAHLVAGFDGKAFGALTRDNNRQGFAIADVELYLAVHGSGLDRTDRASDLVAGG